MNSDKKPSDLVADVFDCMDSPQPEDVDGFLREEGYDPEAVGRDTSAFANDLIRAIHTAVARKGEKQ